MTPGRRRLALRAANTAYRIRQKQQVALDQPCCVFDLAEGMGIEVRFADIPSAEGIYSPTKPVIIVSSLRPPGRQAFTCAHEVGHHAYGHGEQFDELVGDRAKRRRYDPEEFEADCFASALLMPKTAVLKGMAVRGWSPKTTSAEQIYVLASWLGVGYATLVGNMNWGMNLLGREQANALENVKLPQIRHSILGWDCEDHLIVVDRDWTGRPIDAQVDDVILFPGATVLEGTVADTLHSDAKRHVVRASNPGVGRVLIPGTGWAHYVRVSRKQFSGLARFRHLAEVEDE
ncbi:MAG: ImmA/IrrE family metallo-endopeptidase [Terriglobia bacterium]